VWGVDTDAGFVRTYVDGIDAGGLGPFGNFPDQTSNVSLGETWIATGGTGYFQGIVDMDDFRVGLAPLPSALALTAAPAAAGVCFPVAASLNSSAPLPDGGPATGLLAPYDVTVVPSGASFFHDAQCAQALSSILLAAQSSSVPFYALVPDAGTVLLGVAQPESDFLPGQLLVSVFVADGGSTAGPDGGEPDAGAKGSYYVLHCSSGETAGTGAWVGAALLALLLKRRLVRPAGAG